MYTKYKPLNSSLFIKNRRDFGLRLEENAIAIFNSNYIYPISADSTFPFVQHSDIYYLSGIDQENTILVLISRKSFIEEYLFIKEADQNTLIWEGNKLNKKQAKNLSGITTIYELSTFNSFLKKELTSLKTVYLNKNEHNRYKSLVETNEDRFSEKLKQNYPSKIYKSSFSILQELRAIKKPEEIKAIKKACKITEKGFRRVLSLVKPNLFEYEIEAQFIYEFLKHGSEGFAYQPIVAGGKNACILHYTYNNKKCKDGNLLLLDVAAKYAKYSSDLSRTIPVNGKFTKRQKAVYQAVLNVKKFAESILVAKNTFAEYNKAIGEFITKELVALKLIDKVDLKNQTLENPAYKKYFMHGSSHFLGLDTHDYGDYTIPFKENMVFTIEPGIYIPKEKIGIRLEDNYVVRNGKPTNLMKNIPIEIEEIEDLMNA